MDNFRTVALQTKKAGTSTGSTLQGSHCLESSIVTKACIHCGAQPVEIVYSSASNILSPFRVPVTLHTRVRPAGPCKCTLS